MTRVGLPARLVVVAACEDCVGRATEIAEHLGVELHVAGGAPTSAALVVGENDLTLRLESGPTVSARSDLLSTPRSGGVDGLYRAVLAGNETVIDATAGLGADAFHLASRGVRVTMVERSPVVVALLADALARARAGTLGADAAAAAGLLDLVEGDAVTVLGSLSAGVIVLDPMFPVRTKSAATNKGMEALRAVTGEEPSDQFALLAAARRSATRRVVVKRGVRDAPLAGVPPSGTLAGRSVRFDLYAPSL